MKLFRRNVSICFCRSNEGDSDINEIDFGIYIIYVSSSRIKGALIILESAILGKDRDG